MSGVRMNAADSRFSSSRETPVSGRRSSAASLRSASASNSCIDSASTDSALSTASRSRDFSASTLGQGVSSDAFDSPWMPRSSRTGNSPPLDAQKYSPLRKSKAIRLKPL